MITQESKILPNSSLLEAALFNRSTCNTTLPDSLTMPLVLLPAEIDDIPEMTELFLGVFLSTCEITRRIYPNGATPTIVEYVMEGNVKKFKDPDVIYMKVVDTDQGKG